MSDQLATIAQIKARLGITDTTDDTMLTEILEQVSDWIEHYTGRKLVADNAATYTFDTTSGFVLRVPQGIRTVTSMGINTISHQPDSGGSYTTLNASDILLRPLAADRQFGWPATEVRLSRATSYVFGTIENGATITGNFGFATTPPEIQSVCIDASVSAYTVRKQGASGVIGAEDNAVTPWVKFFSKGSPQRATLDRYHAPGIG